MLKTFMIYLHYLMAFNCQQEYKIPASVQLAQSMLESGYGYSTLAKKTNNCFGIKAFSNWKGDVYRVNQQDAYRKYDCLYDSYRDHAEFMVYHYKSMVGKPWQYWIANCKGYAGHSDYWKMLGDIIVTHKLYKFDTI